MWTCNGIVLLEQIGRVLQKEKEQINRKFSSHLSPNCPPPVGEHISTVMLTHLRLPVTAFILPWQFFPHTMALLSRAAVTSSVQFQHVPAGEDKEESCLQQQPALLTISPYRGCDVVQQTAPSSRLIWCVIPSWCHHPLLSVQAAPRWLSLGRDRQNARTHKTSKHPRSSCYRWWEANKCYTEH